MFKKNINLDKTKVKTKIKNKINKTTKINRANKTKTEKKHFF